MGELFFYLMVLGVIIVYAMYMDSPEYKRKKEDRRKKLEIRKNKIAELKRKGYKKWCPYCLSTNFEFFGVKNYGARPAEYKVKYSLDLNPFHPFTLFNEREKLVRPAYGGIDVPEFVCMKCGKVFR